MDTVETVKYAIHAATNSFSLISGYAQLFLTTEASDDIRIIHEEANRAAILLSLVPFPTKRRPKQELPPKSTGGRKSNLEYPVVGSGRSAVKETK